MKKVLLIIMAMFAIGFQNVRAQDAPLKIVTNHPDFKIKIKRCAASGNTVIIDLILSNEGVDDVEEMILWACTTMEAIVTYDDQGNMYKCGSNLVKVANSKEFSDHDSGTFQLLSGVPIQLSIRIDGVSLSAEQIARISLPFNCQNWGLTSNKPVKINNIPIIRNY